MTFAMRNFKIGGVDLDKASVLITGGTGSFGKMMVRTLLARHNLRRLVVFSRDELKQYDMAQEFSPEKHRRLRYFIGDVRDAGRLEMAPRDIDYVIHTAALKQVPAAEYNPFECINTNVYGAENIVRAAFRAEVKIVVALSTDKAASPINLYGASKLASDKIFVTANNVSGSKDLALALAPDMSHRTVGIRPGEKLHEVMITENDARTTLESNDRYVVEPAFASWKRQGLGGEKMHPVHEAFRYGSDTNNEFPSVDEIHALLKITSDKHNV